MQKIGIILDDTNTLILGKDKSILRYEEINDLKKQLRKKLIFRPKLIVCSDTNNIESINIKTSKTYYCEISKLILISRKVDMTKSSASLVINIDNKMNIGVVSLGKEIKGKNVNIEKLSEEEIINEIKSFIDTLRIEIYEDITEKGIILSGNNKKILDILSKLRKELEIPVFISDNPADDKIEGMKLLLDDLSILYY